MRPRAMLFLPLLFGCSGESTGPAREPPEAQPPAIPAEATAWLEANSHPFDGSRLTLPHDDLEFLRDIIGDARIVALGENTHGTRDFFEMKARILRFLVEEMGFDAFAIEATWPESNRLDRYVRTGEGDPAVLLSGLYFWTWNTESVLEMIHWIRSHNEAGGNVGFHGFDMQFPGMALHNVRGYVNDVDPASGPEVDSLLSCMARFVNGPDGRSPSPDYRSQNADYRSACRRSLAEARAHLDGRRAAYEAASSPGAFEFAQRSLRVAVQYDMMITGEQTRDESMAENTVWLADRLGPDSRLVLWAHNFHVATVEGAQGSFLRQAFRDDMVVIGFSHEQGSFTAVTQNGATYTGLGTHVLDEVLDQSYEHYFSTVAAPRFVLDLRARNPSDAAAAWLVGPRPFRSIGCCFYPVAPSRYWVDRSLTLGFDVIIHFRNTRATTVLPFRYPSVF